MPGTYNSNANAFTMSDANTQDANLKAILWSKALQEGARQRDDFSILEGSDGSAKPVYTINDLSKQGGDKVTFTIMSDLAGPGVRGEAELTGNTSTPRFKTFQVQVDYWRDAFEVNQKAKQFMATGGSIEAKANMMLREKLGRQRMYDAMECLIRKANGNILRPGGRASRDAITAADTLDPSFCQSTKIQATRIGARPINVSRDKNQSPTNRFMVFATESALLPVTSDSSYQNALHYAGERGDSNPLFSGRLVDWDGMCFFKHEVVDADWDDVVGSPLSPRVISAVAFGVDSANSACIVKGSSTNTKNKYTQFMPGYDWTWIEGQSAVTDSATYYAWGITPAGRVGFVSYTGSGNDGNKITLTGILSDGAGTSTIGATSIGNVNAGASASTTSDVITPGGTGANLPTGFTYTDQFPVGTYFLSANANGVPIGHSFMFGKGALCRAYGSVNELPIEQMRDFGFVKGFGYMSIFGQSPYVDTTGRTPHYVLMEHAISTPGLEVPVIS